MLKKFCSAVWPEIEKFFNKYGPSKYAGYLGRKEQGWFGPYVWSEDGDVKRVVTRFCEDSFGFHCVHNESRIGKLTYENFDGKREKRPSIDIDVTDATKCRDHKEFRKLQHGLFIEVKRIAKGCIWKDSEKKKEGFKKDCKKLQEQIERRRCRYAIAILIDDGDKNGKPYVENKMGFIQELKKKWPDVRVFVWQKPRYVQ